MNEKKNIDRLFQEKFKDFEVAPNDAVWNRISESLPKKKKKRRVIALWWQIGGVAAAIAILLTVGVSVFDSDNNSTDNPVIVDSEDQKDINSDKNSSTSPEDKQKELQDNAEFDKIELVDSEDTKQSIDDNESNDSQYSDKNSSNKLTSPNNSQKSNTIVNNTSNKKNKTLSTNPKNLNKINGTTEKVASTINNSQNSTQNKLTDDHKMKSVIKETIKDNSTTITQNNTEKESDASQAESENNKINSNQEKEKETTLLEDPKKQSIETAIAVQEDINEKEKEDEQNRWSIKPNVAPVYFSSLGQGSSIDSQFNQNSKSSDISMSYGITGTYAISKKLKVRAGINRVNLNQSTSDVFAFTDGELAARGAVSHLRNVTTKDGLHNVGLMSASMFNRNSTPEIFFTKITGDIEQRMGFIEVPLELEYRLLDKKFGLNVIGGFSTFFLNQNDIYADIEGTSTLIGEANNINSTSFSANLGLGLDYKLSKQWNINLEPQFKYQINTFNNTSGNFRPFFIGVYTGLSFKF